MCHFLSAIYRSDGSLLCDPEHTDSHTDILEAHGISDKREAFLRHWVRVELTSPDDLADVEDLSKWNLSLDEGGQAPEWWESKVDKCREAMEREVSRMFVKDARKILLGGCWILLSGAVVDKALNCRVVAMLGDSQIRTASSVRVNAMRGASRVSFLEESSLIGMMYGSSRVDTMMDSSVVCEMLESSQVSEMEDSSLIGAMWGSSRVVKMYGSSRIARMFGSSQAPESPTTDNRPEPEVIA